MSDHTLHLVPAAYFRDGDRSAPYAAERFDEDGFIHCTDGAAELAATGTRHYRDDRRMYVALVIDKRRVPPSLLRRPPAVLRDALGILRVRRRQPDHLRSSP